MESRLRRQRRRMTTIDGRHFVGEWTVKAGSPNVPADAMKIAVGEGTNTYKLQYLTLNGWKTLQVLEYMHDTHTLENLTDESGLPPLVPGHDDPERREPQRCITFWNCRARNSDPKSKCTIFAMRIGKNQPPDTSALPAWEGAEDSENGSWGAEEEGGG